MLNCYNMKTASGQTPNNYHDPDFKNRFYAGQKVICVRGRPQTGFDKGKEYIVSSYEYKKNPVNGLYFWYVGIVGTHEWLNPTIFVANLENFQAMAYERVLELEKISEN